MAAANVISCAVTRRGPRAVGLYKRAEGARIFSPDRLTLRVLEFLSQPFRTALVRTVSGRGSAW